MVQVGYLKGEIESLSLNKINDIQWKSSGGETLHKQAERGHRLVFKTLICHTLLHIFTSLIYLVLVNTCRTFICHMLFHVLRSFICSLLQIYSLQPLYTHLPFTFVHVSQSNSHRSPTFLAEMYKHWELKNVKETMNNGAYNCLWDGTSHVKEITLQWHTHTHRQMCVCVCVCKYHFWKELPSKNGERQRPFSCFCW